MQHSKNHQGFTLIELAIVLLVVSLLVGGIIAGKTLQRSSNLQTAIQEYTKYTNAIIAFRDKYNALPGDFAGATTLWGAAHATPATCITTVGTGTQTCNGDGNGRIVTMQTNYATTYYEQFRAWQHLSNAQMIEGSFTGTATSGTYSYTIGTNIPASKLGNSGWKLLTITTRDISAIPLTDIGYTTGDIPPNVLLWLGGIYFEDTNRMWGTITPMEAYDIDKKLDDGFSTTGKIISQNDSGMSACDDGSTGYTTGSTANRKACALVFKTGL